MKHNRYLELISLKNNLSNNVKKFNDKISSPSNSKFKSFNSNSWFTVKKKPIYNIQLIQNQKIPPSKNNLIKCEKISLRFNNDQKEIVLRWMNAATTMYNIIIKYFHKLIFDKIEFTMLNSSYFSTRNIFKIERNNLSNIFNTPIHLLDYTIRDACKNLKSALTNLKNKNIKHFRLGYRKLNNLTKIITIEAACFHCIHNSFYVSYLGNYVDSNNYSLNSIKTECTLRYESNKKRFTLFVPNYINSIQHIDNSKKTISIDPGVRTFITGISDNHILELGDNVSKKIGDLISKLDRFNDLKISKKKKKTKAQKINNKIKNLVTDLHWKIIKYLVNHYQTIIIGKWSTKKCSRKGSKIQAKTKRIMSYLSFYKFMQKLEYKCKIERVNLHQVQEEYTTQMCSKCGMLDENIGSSKKYNCKNENCKNNMDRDVNSSRNIFLRWKKK